MVDSVSALGEAAYYPGPASPVMSASSNNPRFARQAEPLMPYRLELQTKVIPRFPKISQSRRRPGGRL